MAWLERTEEHSDTEAEGEPPQQRAHPYTEHQDRRAPESRFGPAEADRGKDGEEGKNCDRVGQGQREGRGVVPRQTTGIRRRGYRGVRPGQDAATADNEKKAGAGESQRPLIVEKPLGNDGEAEPRDDPKNRVSGGRAEPRYETRELAFENRTADAHDPDRTGDHHADHDAFQKKRQKQLDGTPGNSGASLKKQI